MRARSYLSIVSVLMVLLTVACAPSAPAPTAAPAKPTEAAKTAASPAASPGASPAASPVASPVASPAASPVASPAAAPAATKPVAASTWRPQRPVELVVQAAAGGGSDIFARMMADIMTKERLVEQPVNVVNKAGGSGAVAYSYLNEKKGDPHYIATATGTYLTTPLQGQSPVSFRDFTNLATLAAEDVMSVVRSDSPHRTLKDLVEAAKARPSGIRFGGSSVGSTDTIAMNRLERVAGIKLNYITFQSGGEVNAALLGGSVDVATPNPSEAAELIKAGRLRGIGVFSPQRLVNYPDVPTAREQGYDAVVEQYRGVVAPGGITEDQSLYWQGVLQKAFESPQFQSYLSQNSLRPLPSFGPDAQRYIEEENGRLTEAMRDLGILKQ